MGGGGELVWTVGVAGGRALCLPGGIVSGPRFIARPALCHVAKATHNNIRGF